MLPRGQEALATFEQVQAEKAVEEKQPEASVVLEGELSLSMCPVACFGFQGSVFQQMPEHGSVGHL